MTSLPWTKLSLLCGVLKALGILAGVLCLVAYVTVWVRSPVKVANPIGVAEAAGLKEPKIFARHGIKTEGLPSCGRIDDTSFDMQATDANGKVVSFVVCCRGDQCAIRTP